MVLVIVVVVLSVVLVLVICDAVMRVAIAVLCTSPAGLVTELARDLTQRSLFCLWKVEENGKQLQQ